MKRLLTTAVTGTLLSAVLFFANGCTNEQAIQEDAQKYSEISVLNPNFKPRTGDTFAWYSPIIWSTEIIPESPELRQFLTQLLEEQVVSKGYRMVEDQSQADYIIGAAIVDGKSERSQEINNFFRLFPSLGDSESGLRESEALVGVIRQGDQELVKAGAGGSHLTLWRASIKAYVLGEKVSDDLREQRYRFFAQKLMSNLPATP